MDFRLACIFGIVLTITPFSKGHNADPDVIPVRLTHGTTQLDGLVQVYHDNKWGFVCDDGWDDKDCQVVCHQLGHSGGVAADIQPPSSGGGDIMLSLVQCNGNEAHLGQCQRSHWNIHNCDTNTHAEDAGCRCSPSSTSGGGAPAPATTTTRAPSGGTGNCALNDLAIRPFDSSMPGIGRVEVMVGSSWGLICDDTWDDIDAAVFCRCRGYTDSSKFRAYWSREVENLSPLPFKYDVMNCKSHNIGGHISNCAKESSTGRCNSIREAAAVACTALPPAQPPAAPVVTLDCDGSELKACFTSSQYTFEAQHLKMSPFCSNAPTSMVHDGVCLNIRMQSCDTATEEVTSQHKSYCYNVTYSPYTNTFNALLMDSVWSRRACCMKEKNGKVTGFFKPIPLPHQDVTVKSTTDFEMKCYLDETFQGAPLSFPAQVTLGQDVFCRVSADTWDDHMFLVVPTCRFTNNLREDVKFVFLSNKCPTNRDLHVSYFSIDMHNWGFKFQMPKFQDYDDLYLICDTYICDNTVESKPYCDRSCTSNTRRRRSVLPDEPSGHRFIELRRGPFLTEQRGLGPILLSNGLVAVPHIPRHHPTPQEARRVKEVPAESIAFHHEQEVVAVLQEASSDDSTSAATTPSQPQQLVSQPLQHDDLILDDDLKDLESELMSELESDGMAESASDHIAESAPVASHVANAKANGRESARANGRESGRANELRKRPIHASRAAKGSAAAAPSRDPSSSSVKFASGRAVVCLLSVPVFVIALLTATVLVACRI